MLHGWNLPSVWRGYLTLIGVALCCSASGCSLLAPEKSQASAEMGAQTVAQGSYVVELQTNSQKPTVKNLPLVGDPTIQDALEQSGALQKFSRLDILLVRTVPGTQRRHKMEIGFEPRIDGVPPEQNYALLPNDHLIIKQGSTNPLDSILGGALGSMGSSR